MAKRYKPIISYKLREIPIKQIKVWRTAQARKLDREGISELAKSIKSEGLQNPPMVQKEGKYFMLMSGQRRLAALKRLRAKKTPALVLTKKTQYEIGDAKAASVVENLHRKDMENKDMANACVFLAEKMGKSKAAKSLGLSTTMFKKYHGFAGVPNKLKDMVPKIISRDEATKIYQAIPNITKALKIAERVSTIDGLKIRKRYIALIAQHPRMSHKKALQKAKALSLQRKVRVELPKSVARKLSRQADKREVEPNELAQEIITKWVKSRR